MADLFHDISSRTAFFRKVIIVVLIFVVFLCSLPPISMASPSEEEPSLISLSNLEYKLGVSPEDPAGVPAWVKGDDGEGWKPYQPGIYIEVPKEDKYIWFRTTLPEHHFQGAVLRFYDVGNSMDIYLDGQNIYSNHYLEQPGLRRVFEYYYSRFARLPENSSGKTVYIKALPKALYNKTNAYVLDFCDLTSYENQLNEMLDSGLLNMILGFILLSAGLIFMLLLIFIKVNAKAMLSFGFLSITSGIITLYQSYFKYIIGVPTLFYYLAFISNGLMPAAICMFFKPYVLKKYRKLADVFSMIFLIYTLVMATLDLSGLCWAFAFMPVFFAFFGISACILFVLVLKNRENSQIERRIIVLGTVGYCLTGLYDIIFVIFINQGKGTQYHTWGLIVVIAALVFSMVYRYNDIHRKALEYSGELEEKNKKLKEAHESITELNRSLEQKVLERTEQLNNANNELTEMNEELTAMNEQLMATMDALTDAQEQLVQTEKIAALGKLVAGVAHELNTPVAVISSNIQFEESLLDQVDQNDTSSMKSFFSSIAPLREINREAGERIADIVRNLTNFSRLDESDLKEVNLLEGLDSTVIILGEQIDSKKIAIKKEFSYIPNITCYPKLMNQVFMYLLENAIESVQTGGTITLSTSCSGSNIHISFKDNGGGISAEDLRNVFDPRFTIKGKRIGIGLGLPLSYKIVEKHGGSIIVNSTPGEGSEFIITLPCDRHTDPSGPASNHIDAL